MRGVWLLVTIASVIAAPQNDEVRVSAHAYNPPQLHLTAQTNLVDLEVVVRDTRGRAINGLTKSDFEVLDESKPREIAAFSVEERSAMEASPAVIGVGTPATGERIPPAPGRVPAAPRRSVLLFFDDMHGTNSELQRTQAAARRFVQDGLGPGAQAAVFSAAQGLVLDFTADRDALASAIGKFHSHTRVSENGLQPCPRITPYEAFLIDNNLSLDALHAAVDEANNCLNGSVQNQGSRRNSSLASARNTDQTVMLVRQQASATWEQARGDSLNAFAALGNALGALSRAPGTRVLLVVSTGFLSGMMEAERSTLIDRAVHSGIVIDAMDAKGGWSEAPSRAFDQDRQGAPVTTFIFETSTVGSRNDAMNEVMQDFVAGTGGLFFHNNNDLVGGFGELAAVPETAYLLAIRPDPSAAPGQYHKLKVHLTSKNNDLVQARPGYFTPAKVPANAAAMRPLDQELMAADAPAAIPILLTTRPGKTAQGQPVVSTLVHVDLAPLTFAVRDDRQVQKLQFIGALMDSAGNIIAAKEGAMDLALKNDTLEKLKGTGLNAGLTFAATPGSYKVRVVVQDADGKLAAQNQSVEVPK